MTQMLLDKLGDAPLPEGYEVVDSEVSFLQRALDGVPLVVRGERLCEWARLFCEGRQLTHAEIVSPTQILQQLLPNLEGIAAQSIWAAVPKQQLTHLSRWNLTDWLQNLLPHALWEKQPTRKHAAEWLLWLYTTNPNPLFEPLWVAQSQHWQQQAADETTAHLYAATTPTAALALLDQWLGLIPNPLLVELGEFPLPAPPVWEKRAKTQWKSAVIATQGAIFSQLLAYPVQTTLRQQLAEIVISHLERNPQQMTQAMGHELRRYLNINGQERLLKLLPPPMPNPLPIGPTAVGEWFRHEYLPARHWHNQYGDETSRAHIQSVAEQFAHWYLQEYPPALFGNSLTPHLSFQRTAALSQQGQTAITLVIVPDGLHLLDAAYLHEQIQQRTNRLTVWEDGVAFAPLPTITEICKRALLTGSPPYLALGEPHLGEVVKDSDSPAKAIKIAQEGQLIFWRVTDPDQTYHYHNNSDNLRQEVNGRLMGLAAKIADLVENLPPEIPLRLIITSDHGRLLANSPRTLPVPEGMTSHGRAAYGNSNHAFDEQGFFIADGLVYLHADRFGLVQNAALAFTEETFQTNDGRTGQEKYPHGGLYPEEVVVPWLELMRDAALPAVTATLTGMGDVGQQGQLTLTLLNPADIELTATELVWVINGREHPRPINLTIAPLSEISYSILWPNWPTKPEVQQTRAQLTLHLPNGYAFTTAISVGTIEANEMYQRDNILGDLEL